jgi:DNA-binding response OmpR family regulator
MEMELLVVGENRTLIEMVSAALVRLGISVRAATDESALDRAVRESPPDAVVFDHVRPSDLETLNPRSAGFEGPLLLLTDGSDPQPAQQLAAAHVLQKPFSLARFYARVAVLTS